MKSYTDMKQSFVNYCYMLCTAPCDYVANIVYDCQQMSHHLFVFYLINVDKMSLMQTGNHLVHEYSPHFSFSQTVKKIVQAAWWLLKPYMFIEPIVKISWDQNAVQTASWTQICISVFQENENKLDFTGYSNEVFLSDYWWTNHMEVCQIMCSVYEWL